MPQPDPTLSRLLEQPPPNRQNGAPVVYYIMAPSMPVAAAAPASPPRPQRRALPWLITLLGVVLAALAGYWLLSQLQIEPVSRVGPAITVVAPPVPVRSDPPTAVPPTPEPAPTAAPQVIVVTVVPPWPTLAPAAPPAALWVPPTEGPIVAAPPPPPTAAPTATPLPAPECNNGWLWVNGTKTSAQCGNGGQSTGDWGTSSGGGSSSGDWGP